MAHLKRMTIDVAVTDTAGNTYSSGVCVCVQEIFVKDNYMELGVGTYRSVADCDGGKDPIKVALIGDNVKPTVTNAELGAGDVLALAATKLEAWLEDAAKYGAASVTILA